MRRGKLMYLRLRLKVTAELPERTLHDADIVDLFSGCESSMYQLSIRVKNCSKDSNYLAGRLTEAALVPLLLQPALRHFEVYARRIWLCRTIIDRIYELNLLDSIIMV